MLIDRRSLLLTGTLGLGAYAVPGFTQNLSVAASRGFTHAVASGEPASDSMLLWTRYVPADGGAVELRVELSATADFARVVAGGSQVTGPWRDHTAKITVEGLAPATTYHYRFVAPDGTLSPVGTTRTLPDGDAAAFRAAIFSCSNYGFGWFNAYGHAAARRDLDLWVHLGDYFYEYAPDHYPVGKDQVRVPAPATETIHLADYRLRYASYRADRDLQALHAKLPMVAQWDDHESANDSWEGGAENHDPATEGDWNARRSAAVQAYREWMPVSEEPWTAYRIGSLATLYKTETRLFARTHQPDIAAALAAPDRRAALIRFRDGPWSDPAATMMGTQQEDWLFHAMQASVKAGTRWQVVGFGTIMGEQKSPPDALGWLGRDASAKARAYVEAGVEAAAVGLPDNFDSWGGYPAARARFLHAAQNAGADLVVLSGDSHNAWAFDLAHEGRPAGVEFAGHSVTSPGYEAAVTRDPREVARALVGASHELKWCDTSRRGYMAMTITPDAVSNDWIMVDTIKRPTLGAGIGHRAEVRRGRNVMTA